MKEEFLVGYDKVASLAAPGYIDSEISMFLSQAQERFVKQRLHPKGNKYQEGFEETEKRRKDLSAVTKTGEGTVSATQDDIISTNSVIFDMPDDYWLTSVEWVETDDECKEFKEVNPITHDEYFAINENPFKKPSVDKVLRLDVQPINNIVRHEILGSDEFNILKYKFRYIKNLTDIDVENDITSELHPMTHREIVGMAVTIALENSQEPRVQSQSDLEQRAE